MEKLIKEQCTVGGEIPNAERCGVALLSLVNHLHMNGENIVRLVVVVLVMS